MTSELIRKYNPTVADVHTNRQLTDLSEAYYQDESSLLASSVFPIVPVDRQSNFFYVWNRGDFFRDDAQLRAPGTEVHRGGARLSTTTYNCATYDYGDSIPDEVESEADDPLRPRQTATRRVLQVLLIRRERIFCQNFLATGKWTTDITGVASSPASGQVLQWDVSGSTPIDDVNAGRRAIKLATGFEPNTLVLGYDTRLALDTNAQITDRLKYGQTPGNIVTVNDSDLAQVFKVQRVITAGAIYASSNENSAGTYTMSFIAGKVALLCYAAPAPGIDTPSAGYCFVNRNQFVGANSLGAVIKEMRNDPKYRTDIDGFINFDMKKTSADLGYFFNSIVS